MKIEKTDSKIKVELDGKRIGYDKKRWSDEEKYLTSEGLKRLEEWKIDLIKNYGVDIDELQS